MANPETNTTGLTQAEAKMFKAALESGSRIDLILDRKMTTVEAYETLAVCCAVMGHAEGVKAKMRPLIGRLLVSIQNTPEVYTRLGYPNFEAFLQQEVVEKLGVSRSDAYMSKRVATAFPTLSVERQSRIGVVSMGILSAHTKEGNSDCKELLKIAETSTISQLKTKLVERDLMDPARDDQAVINILTTKDIKEHWDGITKDGRVHSVVGSRDHGAILDAALGEFESSINETEQEG